MRLGFALMLLLLAPAAAGAEMFKCRMPDGSLAFLDHACPAQAKALENPKLASELPFAWRCGKDEPAPIDDKDALADLSPAQRQALAGVAYGLAYSRTESRVFLDRGNNVHICSEPANHAPLELVVTTEGRLWSRQGGKVERVGAPDRSTRLAGCSSRITGCYKPNSKSLDQCADEVPICTTNEAVEGESCCAAACIERYRELRAQNVDPMSALDRALFKNEACSGVKAAAGAE